MVLSDDLSFTEHINSIAYTCMLYSITAKLLEIYEFWKEIVPSFTTRIANNWSLLFPSWILRFIPILGFGYK